MLVSIDILVSENIIMNLSHRVAVIKSCDSIKVSLTINTKSINQINHTILVKQCTVISSQSNFIIAVLQSELSCNCDFLFKSNCCQTDTLVYTHIVDHVMTEVYVQNDDNISLIISQKL